MSKFASKSPLLVLLAMLSASCGGPGPDDGSVEQAFRTGYSRFQSGAAAIVRRCIESGGATGAVVSAKLCSNFREEQGFVYDSAKQWIKGQATGPAKCLAANPAGRVINAVCTDGVAAQRWVKVAVGNTGLSRFTSGGKCLQLSETGALSVAACAPSDLAQQWRLINDVTLDEALTAGPLGSSNIPTGAPDVVVPATPDTITFTDHAITRWELSYIKFQPARVPYEISGIVVVGRDEYDAPRAYFRATHTFDPAKLRTDVHHTWTVVLPGSTQNTKTLDVLITGGAATRTIANGVAGSTAHATMLALLLRDIAATSVARSPIKDAADIVKSAATTDGAALLIVEIGSTLLAPVCWQCTVIANLIPLARKAFPDNPPGGTNGCFSGVTNVRGGSAQCVLENRPSACPADPADAPNTSCGVQNTHPAASTTSHSRVGCSTPVPTGPGLSCTKSPVPPGKVLCDIDCVQTHTECEWVWCKRQI